MDLDRYNQLLSKSAPKWADGPWFGEAGNFEFLTRTGHVAAIRRHVHDGFLWGAVYMANPEHPLVLSKNSNNCFSIDGRAIFRLSKDKFAISDATYDLPCVVPGGNWFIFHCGNNIRDLIPRHAHNLAASDSLVYRDVRYVKSVCEDIGKYLALQWNNHLLERVHTKVAGVPQPSLSVAEMQKHMTENYLTFPPPLSGIGNDLLKAYFPPGKSLPLEQSYSRYARVPAPPARPKCNLKIENWKTYTSSVSHEIKVIEDGACQITITGYGGKILAQFVVREGK